ncbi:hypothetical protein DFJ74DRAFT_646196 [Hyaloraphidium curvatum]|nr:hypothetical protein DFJ74DRAFT_646196 [Hyaloraphidium curvatum]
MAKRITRFYVQLYLIQAVIGIVARGRGKVDHEALRRLPGNIAGSIAFFLSFAAIERFLTCRVAPRPIKDNLLAYGVLTAFAARVASRFESEQRLIGINKLMIGYIASEFMPGAGIFYLVAIFVAYGTGLAQTEDLIRSTITANFQ